MKALVQRVSYASVQVRDQKVGEIGSGLLVFLGVQVGDGQGEADWISHKILSLRIFSDEAEKMNRSVVEVTGSILLVSQFTLCADLARGNRPSFASAASPAEAAKWVDWVGMRFAEKVSVQRGEFGAHMKVSLLNDGPVTIWLDSKGG